MSVAQLRKPDRALKGNITDYLLEYSSWRGFAQRPYLIAPDRTWSFEELAERVGRIGNALRVLGVKPGERVLFSVVDGIDFSALFLAIMKIGAVGVPINTYLKPHDYRFFTNDSDAKVVVFDYNLVPVFAEVQSELSSVRHFITTRSRSGELPFLDALATAQPPQCESFPSSPDDMAFWLYSSGSTGVPKGVVHTGSDIFWATELFGLDTLNIESRDLILSPPKMYFAFGLGNQVYFPIRAGAQVIVNPDPITPQRVLELWLQHAPTVIFGVPTIFAGVLNLAQNEIGQERMRMACRRLRLCISGGEILPPALLQRWRDFANIEILDGVGTTEMTHMFIINRPGRAVPGSCGRLVPGFRAEIVDDDDKPVTKGEIGNLRMFGPTAARQYWNQPEKTAAIMGGGGVLTGDKVYEDDDGNLFLVGRSDDMLRVGGIWVSPAEVESVIALHDDVLECAVVGHPDADSMIKPKAYVVPRTMDADRDQLASSLRSHVRERLAHIKCPRWFEIVDELPKTSTGKIQRFRLRDHD
jgi:benzoate-CoA ligase family protein